MIVNETKPSIQIFNKYFCDFCNKQFQPYHYIDYICHICDKDICRDCGIEIKTDQNGGEFNEWNYRRFCPDCNGKLSSLNNQVDFYTAKLEKIEEELDIAMSERWRYIKQLKQTKGNID